MTKVTFRPRRKVAGSLFGRAMLGLFNSVTELVGNVAKVVVAPVEMAADLANAALQPIVEVAKDLANDIKSLKD